MREAAVDEKKARLLPGLVVVAAVAYFGCGVRRR